MFQNYPYYPPMYPPQGGGNPIENMRETLRLFDEMEERSKKKSDSNKPKDAPKLGKMFTKLEVFGLLCSLGPFIGYGYLMILMGLAQNMATLIQTTVK